MDRVWAPQRSSSSRCDRWGAAVVWQQQTRPNQTANQTTFALPSSAFCVCRDALLAGSSGTSAQQQRAKETEATAELDNKGLVQLQQQIMQQQDHELEQMEKTVVSTKVRGAANADACV